jgi:hypothetical protein
MNKSRFYLYLIIALFIIGFSLIMIFNLDFSFSETAAAVCREREWRADVGCFSGSGSVDCRGDGYEWYGEGTAWCNGKCLAWDWGKAEGGIVVWEWGANYGDICAIVICERCVDGNGNGDNGGGAPPPPPPPPSVNLNGEETVMVPDPIALSWSSSNADSCSASGDWSGAKPTSGSETIKSKTTTADRGDYNYSLSCSGPGGSASDSLSIKVIQVPRCVFTANPENIILPQFSTLTWECEYCIPGTAYINQGIGDVDCSGSQPVRPDKTTSYILSASGWDGQRLFQADVGVGFRPVIREIIPR